MDSGITSSSHKSRAFYKARTGKGQTLPKMIEVYNSGQGHTVLFKVVRQEKWRPDSIDVRKLFSSGNQT